jgi:DNA-binding NtrC family response regulator
MYRRMVKYLLELNPDHEVHIFETGRDCIKNLNLQPQIVSLDYSLPDMTGEEVLRKIKQHNKEIGVIILSGQQDITTAVKLLKEGAHDYIVKDNETKERLLNTVEHLKKRFALEQEVEILRSELHQHYQFGNSIKGESPVMQEVFQLIDKAIRTNITVSITGETGTGKEVVAKSIHYNSPRKTGNFVAINMGAIPKELLESELFGHEKGAFTGAMARKIGKFELANKGTLFLDEVAEIDLSLQAKLLRALQEREIVRIGGNTPIPFDARIIVATHKNLAEEVGKGNFREDLYYRLLGLPIQLPPLRDRGNDIILLAKHFLDEFARLNRLPPFTLTREAKNRLLAYNYPGNIRELKAIVELAAVMTNSSTIQKEDLQFNSPKTFHTLLSEEMSLREYTHKIILHFLEKYNHDVILVAEKLNIGKSTIYRMLKEEIRLGES